MIENLFPFVITLRKPKSPASIKVNPKRFDFYDLNTKDHNHDSKTKIPKSKANKKSERREKNLLWDTS